MLHEQSNFTYEPAQLSRWGLPTLAGSALAYVAVRHRNRQGRALRQQHPPPIPQGAGPIVILASAPAAAAAATPVAQLPVPQDSRSPRFGNKIKIGESDELRRAPTMAPRLTTGSADGEMRLFVDATDTAADVNWYGWVWFADWLKAARYCRYGFFVVACKALPYIIYLYIFGLCCSRFFLLVFCSLRAEQLRVLGSPAAWDSLKQE